MKSTNGQFALVVLTSKVNPSITQYIDNSDDHHCLCNSLSWSSNMAFLEEEAKRLSTLNSNTYKVVPYELLTRYLPQPNQPIYIAQSLSTSTVGGTDLSKLLLGLDLSLVLPNNATLEESRTSLIAYRIYIEAIQTIQDLNPKSDWDPRYILHHADGTKFIATKACNRLVIEEDRIYLTDNAMATDTKHCTIHIEYLASIEFTAEF